MITKTKSFITVVIEETPAEKCEKVKVWCLCGCKGGYIIQCERWSAEEANSVTCKRDELETRSYESHIPKWKSNHSYCRNNTKPVSIPSCKNIQAQDSNKLILSSQINTGIE